MLDREEYVEQAYFFRSLVDGLEERRPVQEIFQSAEEEVLSTTKLPMAINYMLGELKHSGCFAPAMAKLGHYFSRFQTYVIAAAEKEAGRFDMRVAVNILRFLAEFMAKAPVPQAVFLFQFEVLCRNRLGYEEGLDAMAHDLIDLPDWSDWVQEVRRQIGILGLADMMYVRSEYYLKHRARLESTRRVDAEKPILFSEKEGKIALANRRKDPLLLFAALQRHLGYPPVPRLERADTTAETIPLLIRRTERLEQRVKLIEEEQKGGIDITKFYNPNQLGGFD